MTTSQPPPQQPSFPIALLCAALVIPWTACANAPSHVTRDRYVGPSKAPVITPCSPERPAQTWGVVMGVNNYQDNRIADLGGAVNDAWLFYHYLVNPNGGKVPTSNVKLLLNKEANQRNILDALGNFLGQACTQDQIVIYFAGHGIPEPARPEEAYLLAHDTDLSNLVGSAVPMSKLPSFLQWRAGNAGKLLMFVDACHAGAIQFPDARGGTLDRRFELVNDGLERVIKDQKGWGALSAAASDQLAQEAPEKWSKCELGGRPYGGGIFTCHLVEGLSGKADDNRDGSVTLDEIHSHVARTVRRDSRNMQSPQLSGDLDRNTVLASIADKDNRVISIPQVPALYTLSEADENPPIPTPLWASLSIGTAALVTGGVFHLLAELETSSIDDTTTNDPASRTQSGYLNQRNTRDNLVLTSQISYISGAALLGVSALWFGLRALPLEGREDVYEQPPWFNLTPIPGGASTTLTFSWN